jgi:hypothetical protein
MESFKRINTRSTSTSPSSCATVALEKNVAFRALVDQSACESAGDKARDDWRTDGASTDDLIDESGL